MRAVSLVLIAGLLSLATVSAEAASINPNPVNETRTAGAPGGALNANLTALSVSGNVAIFELSVVSGSVTGIDIGMLLSTLTPPPAPTLLLVTGATFLAGSGTGGTASIGGGGTQAQFDFSSVIGAGGSSQQMRVTFAGTIPTGYFGTVNFDNGYVTTKDYQVVAPEPAALVLAGLALAGIGAVRRRRSD